MEYHKTSTTGGRVILTDVDEQEHIWQEASYKPISRLEILQKATIHPTAKIHPTAIIGSNVVIEEGVEIGPYCLVGMPPEDKRYPTADEGVIICKGTKLTGLVTVDTGTKTPTVIGENSYLMKHSHIGHDAFLAKEVTVSCGAKVGGWAQIGNYVNIGLNATIHQETRIPEGVMLGMGSVVTKKSILKDWTKYAGVPVKEIGSNEKYKR